ncbi:polysaccharide deacetylase family protein [Blastococcus tunisiensis]|uniref:Polysaccharide deacetylase n=1 Tax=Blastococcus tunisiensis TaxID=1798228 RepID=A0A1I2JB21_9ACTN|nr:polysaccharide deacetylase family protein [Blastococcus sp. DSM 46838]SFF51180.1 Polysaccharide deacetylase [Blastococcus sp. DSM 46838]
MSALLATGNRRAAVPPAVPVLLYHAITDTPGRQIAPYSVSPAVFAEHLSLLVGAGFRCVPFGALMSGRGGPDGWRGDERIAVITFDDGYADFATAALPALQARGLPSTLYVTTGWLAGSPVREPGPEDRMLAWGQLPELVEAGVELGAHSHSHPQLDTLGGGALRDELSTPRRLLEDALGRPVTTFAYPHGYHGPRVRRLTEEAGYASAAGVRNAVSRPGEHPFSVSRLMVTRDLTPARFSAWLEGRDGRRSTHREAPATTGWRAYRRARAVVRRRPGSDYR